MADVSLIKLLGSPVQLLFSGGVTPQGEYNNATNYETGDSVSYLGSSYVAIQGTVGNLPTNATYWQLLAEKGDVGDTGPQGPAGNFVPTFESVSKNLDGNSYTLQFTGAQLTSITYALPASQEIVKTLGYTGDKLTSIVLSGDVPGGIPLTKTLGYTGDLLTSITYS